MQPCTISKVVGRHHLAFQACNREMVNAFVLNPDGNNIDTVYHGEGERSAPYVKISFIL